MKMFRIENDRDCFYQWDLNQRLIVSGLQEGDEVHFASGRDKAAEAPVLSVYTENDMNVVDVPNSLLQTAGSLQAYAYIHTDDGAYTKWEESFFIIRRPKPADYVYTETEVRTWAELDERLKKVEEKEISSEAIAEAVEAYMEENPVEETDPTVPAWAKAETKPTYTAEEVGAVAADNLQDAVDDALTQAKASGEFDGVSVTHEWNGTVLSVTSASGTSSADLKGEQGEPGEDGQDGSPGADGYTPVKGVDYFTETDKQEIAEQAAQLVEVPEVEIPEALPNPNALTFTGAVEETYDGSKDVIVEIPKCESAELALIDTFDLSTGVTSFELTNLNFKEVLISVSATLEYGADVYINGVFCLCASGSIKHDGTYFRGWYVDGCLYAIVPRNGSGGENIALARTYKVDGTAINTILISTSTASSSCEIFVYAR